MILAMSFLLLSTFVYHFTHQKEAEQFNKAYRENLESSIRNIIRMKENDLMKTTFDYCVWDEMGTYVHHPKKQWADANLNTLLSTLGCSLIAVLNEDFHQVHMEQNTADFRDGSFVLAMEPIREALKNQNKCHFYIYADAGLIEISGAPIVPSNDVNRITKPMGYFVTGRIWDKKFLKDLGDITNADIEVLPNAVLTKQPVLNDWKERKMIVINQFLTDYRNKGIVRLDFISRTQYNQSQNLFLYFTLVPLIISVVLIFVFYFVIRRWITVPLKLLTDSLDNNNPDPLQKISARNREFHLFGSMMIAFFEAKKKLEVAMNERKATEERILKLSTAVDQSSSVIVITDPLGKIDYVSRRFFELTGYSRSEVLGENPRILKSGHHSSGFYSNLWETIRSGKTWKGEFLNRKKDGSFFWEAATITPIKNLEGEIVNFLAVKEDITEQKGAREKLSKYAEELKESNNSKDKFFSILAHDLKAPFHSMLGYSELLANEYDTLSDSDRRKFIQILRTSTKNVYDLVENLLQWSRLQTGRLTCVPELFQLRAEVEYCVDIFRATALKKNIRLLTTIPGEPYVYADKNMVRSILQNLISNALKYTSGNGSVNINAQFGDANTEILVSDTGVGMNKEELDKIFRIDVSYSKKGTAMETGTGLGLILCKELVSINRGTIWVESQVDIGSVFHFTLPSGKP